MAHSIKINNGKETKYKSRPDINARSEEVKVRPDWNQIDPNAPDYVKNRTHGYERVKDLDVEFTMDVESTISYDFGFTRGYKGTLIYSVGTFPENSECIFCRVDCADDSYMGKILELNRFDIPGALITANDTYGYGNPAFYSFDPMDDNDLPILIAKGDNDGEWVVRYYDTFSQEMGGIQVQIGTSYALSEDVSLIRLDEKYIPNTIARVGDIPKIPDKVEKWTKIDYINNKIFNSIDSKWESSPMLKIKILLEIPAISDSTDVYSPIFHICTNGTSFSDYRATFKGSDLPCANDINVEYLVEMLKIDAQDGSSTLNAIRFTECMGGINGSINSNSSWSTLQSVKSAVSTGNNADGGVFYKLYDTITALNLYSSKMFVSGTKITIWGIKA